MPGARRRCDPCSSGWSTRASGSETGPPGSASASCDGALGPSLEAARASLAEGRRPELAELLRKAADELPPANQLMAYALTRHVLEGARVPPAPLLDDLGRSIEDDALVLERHLGCPLPELEARLVRWLSEVPRAPEAKRAGK